MRIRSPPVESCSTTRAGGAGGVRSASRSADAREYSEGARATPHRPRVTCGRPSRRPSIDTLDEVDALLAHVGCNEITDIGRICGQIHRAQRTCKTLCLRGDECLLLRVVIARNGIRRRQHDVHRLVEPSIDARANQLLPRSARAGRAPPYRAAPPRAWLNRANGSARRRSTTSFRMFRVSTNANATRIVRFVAHSADRTKSVRKSGASVDDPRPIRSRPPAPRSTRGSRPAVVACCRGTASASTRDASARRATPPAWLIAVAVKVTRSLSTYSLRTRGVVYSFAFKGPSARS